MSRRQTQTTVLNGKRVRLVRANGKLTVHDAPVEEWRLQAAAVRALRDMPEFVADPAKVGPLSFTLAGDFNAGRRGRQESVKAKATGLTAGEADLRIYAAGGRLLQLEYKNAEGRLTASQKERHPLLRALGYEIVVVKASSEEEAATASVRTVSEWMAANDNVASASI